MKHTYFIEAADNVGKTTCIEMLKNNFISDIECNQITFTKYPSKTIIPKVNELICLQKEIKLDSDDSERKYNKITFLLILLFLNDMKESFQTTKDKSINICDRGWLSTYLYNFRPTYINSKKYLSKYESIMLSIFIQTYLNSLCKIESDIHTIILNNNLNQQLNINETETIEYKKIFDKDKNLQSSVNYAISEIIKMIDSGLYDIVNNFHYINIYDENKNRKPAEALCKEIISIINKEENNV